MRSTVTGVSKYSESQHAEDAKPADLVAPGSSIVRKGPPAKHGGEGLPKDSVKPGGLGVSGMKLAPISEDSVPAEKNSASATADDDFGWAELDKYAALLHQRDAMQKKEQIVRLQSELKKDLDQQVSDKKVRNQKEKESDLVYFHSQIGEIEKWKEKEASKVIDQKVKHLKEKDDRDAQLAYSNSLKHAEVERREEEDRKLLDKIAQDLDTERRLYDTRKQQYREAMAKDWMGTQGQVEEKKKKIAQQNEADTNQMNQYIAMLEQQEKKKKDDSQNRLDAHADFLSRIKAAGLEDEKEKEMSETARVISEQIEANQKAMELERKKRDDLKAMRLENQSYLFEQMKEKQSSKQKETADKFIQAQYLASDTADFHSTELAKLADKRARNMEHRKELEKQINTNSKPYPGLAISQRSGIAGSEVNMTTSEKKMNKRLVAEVKSAMTSTVG